MVAAMQVCCCCFVLSVLITGSILLAVSFVVVEPNFVGIDFNANQMEIDTSGVYEAGRHFLGVGHYFVLFPTTEQAMSFEGENRIYGRTKDGLAVTVELVLYYKLLESDKDYFGLYYEHGPNYDKTFRKVGASAAVDVVSRFTAYVERGRCCCCCC